MPIFGGVLRFRRKGYAAPGLCLAAFLAAGLHGQVIKLATLAPQGSSWHELLMEMGQEWERQTAGELTLRIYPGGVAGDERDMIRKMQIGQIHAAVISVEGLGELSPSMKVFYVPLMVESFQQLAAIQSDLFPVVAGELEDNGIKLLSWLNIGWVYLFSRDRVATPDDLRKMKIFSWAGNYHSVELWRKAGFHPVPLAFTDVLPALQTRMIDAVSGLPLVVLGYQWFALAPHMLNLRWIPVTVGLVMNGNVWASIPEDRRQVILNGIHQGEKRAGDLISEARKAVDVMKQHGLQVHDLDPGERKLWEEMTREMYPLIRGRMVPAEIFDRVVKVKP
ncbi:MAG: TRAP transporter substrate-binding protein DctP [Fidelibacterota bacterium]